MRVLFYEPFAINIPHFGTCLELITESLNEGNEVFFLGCEADFSSCDVNKDHNLSFCYKCIDRRNNGLSKIGALGQIKLLQINEFIKESDLDVNTYDFSDIDALKNFGVDGYSDIGYGVASSLISIFRDPAPDTVINKTLINQLIASSYKAYIALYRVIEKYQIDTVFAYNGRYGELRAALRVCQDLGKDIFLHEAGSDLSKYFLTRNHLIHNVSYMHAEIDRFWKTSPLTEQEKLNAAHDFFVNRRNGIMKNWVSFTKDQEDRLPELWNPSQTNIVVFNSSEDEFAAIGDSWRFSVYESQIDALTKINNSFKNLPDVSIWVRLHPNLKDAPPKLIQPYLELIENGVNVIFPDDKVSTYLLMENANKVITFGSTMGIEAAYWGKISIMIGVCLYQGLGSVYEPKNHEETIEMLTSDILNPLTKEGAIKYGFFIGNLGTKYRHFTKTGIFTGKIKDWDFRPSAKWKILNYLGEKHIISPKIQHKAYQLLIK